MARRMRAKKASSPAFHPAALAVALRIRAKSKRDHRDDHL